MLFRIPLGPASAPRFKSPNLRLIALGFGCRVGAGVLRNSCSAALRSSSSSSGTGGLTRPSICSAVASLKSEV
eukprot:3432468-Karenia_brevis.AAC.1